MACRTAQPSESMDDGLDFEDALSDDEDVLSDGNSQVPVHLPAVVPSGAVVLSEMKALQEAFGTERLGSLPLTEEVMNCRDTMAKVAPPLFAFSRLLAEDQRHAIWSLYGVCSALDDVQTHEELGDMRTRLRRIFNPDLRANGNPDGVWGALRVTLNRYMLIRRPFEDYADGIAKRPSKGVAFKATDDLLAYVYRDSGVIGLIVLPVLAEDAALDEGVVEAAIALGMALKLIDMLNCVGHHYRTSGMCWIPRKCMEQHNVSEEELCRNLLQSTSTLVGDARWRGIMQELLALVPPLLQSATMGGERLPGGACIAVRAAVRMCSRMVAQIETRDYNSLGPHEEMFNWRMVGDVAGSMWGPEMTNKGPAV